MTDDAPEYLTVPELAALLRIKERKVYDLASSGQVPCSRATGKLLFPRADVKAWIDDNRTDIPKPRPNVFLGSHDPLLEWAIRQSHCGLPSFFDGSLDGLRRFQNREGIASGLHIYDSATDGWNIPAVDAEGVEDAVLIAFAHRRRGLVIRDHATDQIRGIDDLGGKRIAARQRQSGAALLLADLLASSDVEADKVSFTETAHSEQDAVITVQQGGADAAFGLEAVARPFGLHFIPLVEERFDLLIDRQSYFEPPIQRLLSFCASAPLREQAQNMGGYDIDSLGAVRWNS
ncbi:MAG: helix-turn-helix transcriptional regulator [Pseudomonadota bacterium]